MSIPADRRYSGKPPPRLSRPLPKRLRVVAFRTDPGCFANPRSRSAADMHSETEVYGFAWISSFPSNLTWWRIGPSADGIALRRTFPSGRSALYPCGMNISRNSGLDGVA